MRYVAVPHKYLARTGQYLVAQCKVKGDQMHNIQKFFRCAWGMIVAIQTARAAEHQARYHRYQEVRQPISGSRVPN